MTTHERYCEFMLANQHLGWCEFVRKLADEWNIPFENAYLLWFIVTKPWYRPEVDADIAIELDVESQPDTFLFLLSV